MLRSPGCHCRHDGKESDDTPAVGEVREVRDVLHVQRQGPRCTVLWAVARLTSLWEPGLNTPRGAGLDSRAGMGEGDGGTPKQWRGLCDRIFSPAKRGAK